MRNMQRDKDEILLTAAGWIQLAGFAWVAWLPVSQPFILYPAMGCVALSSALLWWRQGGAIPRELVMAASVYLVLVSAVAAMSFLVGNPGAAHQTALWLGVPLMWVPWAMSMRQDHLHRTLWVIVGMGGLTAVAVIALAIEALGGPTLPTAFKDLQQMWFTVTPGGQIELAYLGLSSLVALAAFALAASFIPTPDSWLPPRRGLVFVAFLTFVAGVTSGRRGLTVVVLLAPLMAACYVVVTSLLTRSGDVPVARYARLLLCSTALLGVLMASPFGANLNAMVGLPPGITIGLAEDTTPASGEVTAGESGASDGFGGEEANADDDSARADQVPELINGWRAEPLLGQGFGAVLDSGYERSQTRPWMFEIQPLQILLNIGLLGYAVLLLVTGLVLRVVIRAFRTGRHRPTLVASVVTCLCMLIADVTNPYLQAPGHGWAVFLVLGVCMSLLNESTSGRASSATRRAPIR